MTEKSVFVKRFLTHLPDMCNTRFDRILFYYGEWQETYRTDYRSGGGQRIEFWEGVPQPNNYSRDSDKKKMIVLDDLMRESCTSVILDFFTKGCHHKGQNQRDLSLNSNNIVHFKNPRDRAQIKYLARQVYHEDPKFLQEAFIDAYTPPYSYLLLDMKQDTLDEYRFRANIFPDDSTQYAYVPKYSSKYKLIKMRMAVYSSRKNTEKISTDKYGILKDFGWLGNMDRARKMILVPANPSTTELAPLNVTKSPVKDTTDNTVQTSGDHLSRLDSDMFEILNSKKFSHKREKCNLNEIQDLNGENIDGFFYTEELTGVR